MLLAAAWAPARRAAVGVGDQPVAGGPRVGADRGGRRARAPGGASLGARWDAQGAPAAGQAWTAEAQAARGALAPRVAGRR
ncbi:hypothetical protein GCM10027261_28790 [Geodermatophilus arenarius]